MTVSSPTGRLRDPAAALAALLRRVAYTRAQVGERFPLFADPHSGTWALTRRGCRAGGFWVGLLWLRAALGGSLADRAAATRWMHRLAEYPGGDAATRGMALWYGAAAGHRLFADPTAASIALRGARLLNADADAHPGPISRGATFVDVSDDSGTSIAGLAGVTPLLAWAATRSDQAALRKAADDYLIRHIDAYLLPDGAIRSRPDLTADATLSRPHGLDQGAYWQPQQWSRGQAWGILAFTQAAQWLSPNYLEPACSAANWWVSHAPPDVAAPADFADPGGPWDTSASAIAAAALFKLARLMPPAASTYRELAEAHVSTLLEYHVLAAPQGGLAAGTRLVDGHYDEPAGTALGYELVWGTYFLVEALAILTGALKPDAL